MSRSPITTHEKRLPPITPGEILLEEFMIPLGISQNKLARDLDVPLARINDIVHGRRSITADTALRLEAYFGMSAEAWLNLQSLYDMRVARRTLETSIRSRVRKAPTKPVSQKVA